MPTRRQKREGYPEAIRLGLLEDDVDDLTLKAEALDGRLDKIDLWRAKVAGMALLGSIVGGGVVGTIDLIVRFLGP